MTFLRCIASGLQACVGLHHSTGLQEIYTFCVSSRGYCGIAPADKRHRHRRGHVILSSNTCKMNLQGDERAVRAVLLREAEEKPILQL